MKALILDGSVGENNTIEVVHRMLVDELNRHGWKSQTYVGKDMNIAYCAGCFGCWIKTPGVCRIDDAAREVATTAIRSDLVILITPITFGGYSSEAKKLLDRMVPILSPFFTKVGGEIHHIKRYKKYPSLLAIGVLPKPDEIAEGIFTSLVSRNAINMQGPVYTSGVVTPGRPDVIKDKIKSLLDRVGVPK